MRYSGRGRGRQRAGELEREVVDLALDINLEHDVYISPRVLTSGMLAPGMWGQTPFLEGIQ